MRQGRADDGGAVTLENIVFAALAVTFVGGVALATWLATTWPTPEQRAHVHAVELDAGKPWR